MLKLLFLGDIIGEPGRRAVIDTVPVWKRERGIDFVVVNGENSAGGRGITPRITIDLLRAGVAVITTGDHVWDQKDLAGFIDTEPRLLRPINYPEGVPGQGSVVLDTPKGKVGVISTEPSDTKTPYATPRSLIPAKFGNPWEIQLYLEVRSNAPPGAYDINLPK